jgi:hypothetical protein
MKRPAAFRKTDPIKSRVKLIKDAIDDAEGFSDSVKEMLSSTLSVTVGAVKATRHTVNEKFVKNIGEVLAAEQARLQKDLAAKDKSFEELTPAKATREKVLEDAKNDATAKSEAYDAAKKAVTEATAKLKEASSALKDAEKSQKSGDADLEVVSGKKATLEGAVQDSLQPLVDGSITEEKPRNQKVKAILSVGKEYGFDSSLLQTAEPVLAKEIASRGSFDATCLEQMQAAFAAAIKELQDKLDAGAPAKAERAASVQAAETAKTTAEAGVETAKAASQAAKEAKSAADSAAKAAGQSLDDFMPDLKTAGDALDEAKSDLKEFESGPLEAFNELKDLQAGQFDEPEPEEPAEAETAAATTETAAAAPEGSPSKRARTDEA